MPTHIRHSRETRRLVTYLFWFCRDNKPMSHGFIPCRVIEKITGVPGSTVNKIGRGEV